jgi:4-amino-4-deoxy-L-arabinose transferase-like glycosyltransferase
VGVDAACYGRIARELAARPLGDWSRITLGGQEFYDHPPLGFWMEGLAFKVAGASATTAVWLSRFYAFALLALLFLVARRLAGSRAALFSLLSCLAFPGFLYESQNPMLELPLTVFLALGILGAVNLGESPRWGALAFALGFASAAFTKGPPALALFALLLWLVLRRRIRLGRAALGAGAAVLGAGLAILAFEWVRAEQGLEPFWPRYWREQVWESVAEGRGHPEHSPFFYLASLGGWYLAGLLALPVSLWAWRRRQAVRPLLELGWVWSAVLVVGFTLPVQKNAWYIHPVVLGMAAILGGTLVSFVAEKLDAKLAVVFACLALLYAGLITGKPEWMGAPRPEMRAVLALPHPAFRPDEPRDVANCSPLGPWIGDHLFAFYWQVKRVDCGVAAPFRFDGAKLIRQRP